jgi:hypothetical protein
MVLFSCKSATRFSLKITKKKNVNSAKYGKIYNFCSWKYLKAFFKAIISREYTKSIWKVLDNFTEKSFRRNFLTECLLSETPFDRTPFDRTIFDRNTIQPNTVWPFESSFYQKKVIWSKTKFIKRSFDRKYLEIDHLTENKIWKTCQMTEMTFDRKLFRKLVLLPKVHLT